jgi:ubiquinone/menaquinone biosynthesis C-methylase UbiE
MKKKFFIKIAENSINSMEDLLEDVSCEIPFTAWQSYVSTSIFVEPGERVLDVGCGSGHIGKLLESHQNCSVTGIDIMKCIEVPLDFKEFDGRKIPFPDNYFDTLLLIYVFHHVDRAHKMDFLKECIRVTRKKLIIHEDVPANLFDRLMNAFHGWEFKLRTGIEEEPSFPDLEEYISLFKKNNLNLIHTLKFNRFSREWYRPVNRMMFVLSR